MTRAMVYRLYHPIVVNLLYKQCNINTFIIDPTGKKFCVETVKIPVVNKIHKYELEKKPDAIAFYHQHAYLVGESITEITVWSVLQNSVFIVDTIGMLAVMVREGDTIRTAPLAHILTSPLGVQVPFHNKKGRELLKSKGIDPMKVIDDLDRLQREMIERMNKQENRSQMDYYL